MTGRLGYVRPISENPKARKVRIVPVNNAEPLTRQMVQTRVKRAARKAGLSENSVHVLRHTFCSHLAMRGAPARAFQEAAGHKELGTTQRYMHVSPAALDDAIRLLEFRQARWDGGEIMETNAADGRNLNV